MDPDLAENVTAPRYRTLWIVKRGSQVRHMASADVLVVPRPDGFWRIGGEEARLSDSYREEMLWVSTSPDRRLTYEDRGAAERCRGRSFAQVEFVAGDYLQYSGGSVSNCGDKDNEWFDPEISPLSKLQNLRFGINGEHATITEAFGPGGLAALGRATRLMARVVVTDRKKDDPDCCERGYQRGLAMPDEWNWGLRRAGGQLEVFGFVRDTRVYTYERKLALTPPAATFGWHSSPVVWDVVQRSVPGASDAFRSPRGDLLVVTTPTRVVAFTPAASRLGNPVLEIPLRASVNSGLSPWWQPDSGTAAVMAEWATAPFVQKWGDAVDQLGRLPRPTMAD